MSKFKISCFVGLLLGFAVAAIADKAQASFALLWGMTSLGYLARVATEEACREAQNGAE